MRMDNSLVRKVKQRKRSSEFNKYPIVKRKTQAIMKSPAKEIQAFDWFNTPISVKPVSYKTSSPDWSVKSQKPTTTQTQSLSPIKLIENEVEINVQTENTYISGNDSIFSCINLEDIESEFYKHQRSDFDQCCESNNHLLKKNEMQRTVISSTDTSELCDHIPVAKSDKFSEFQPCEKCNINLSLKLNTQKDSYQYFDGQGEEAQNLKLQTFEKESYGSSILQIQNLKNDLQFGRTLMVKENSLTKINNKPFVSKSYQITNLNLPCSNSETNSQIIHTNSTKNNSSVMFNSQSSSVSKGSVSKEIDAIINNLVVAKENCQKKALKSHSSFLVEPQNVVSQKHSLQSQIRIALLQNANVNNDQKSNHLPFQQARASMLEALEFWDSKSENTKPGPFYGLPLNIKELLKTHRGIDKLYDWQDECLSLSSVRNGENLIYSLPTSGGKTLVAEILILQEILCRNQDVLFILPFVAIVQEKVRDLTPFSSELNFLLEEYAGGKGEIPPRKRRRRKSVYIATIEKGQLIVNSLIENQRLHNIGLVIIDELHMIGESSGRGAILENTIAKVLYSSKATRIIAMSATLGNIKDLQTFLKAKLYTQDFRPVELKEFLKIENNIFEINDHALAPEDLLKHHRTFIPEYTKEMKKEDPDQILGLILETIPQNSCLVFCHSKKNCESLSQMICKMLPKTLTQVKSKEKQQLKRDLVVESNGKICPILRKTIPYGVAYHHSGLTSDERKSIEEAYSNATLCIIMCTSTLAAGVNLPAKRVILRSPYIGRDWLTYSKYKQMAGRAGRTGLDSTGESIMVIRSSEQEKIIEMLSGSYDDCVSSLLIDHQRGLQLLLLSIVGLGVVTSKETICEFMESTLLHVQRKILGIDLEKEIDLALTRLTELGLVKEKLKTSQEDCTEDLVLRLEITKLGKAAYKGGVAIDCCQKLYNDLKSSVKGMVLCNHLHLLYIVTPYDLVGDLIATAPMTYYRHYSSLTAEEIECATKIGVPESCIVRQVTGQKTEGVDDFVVKRFYLTLILYQLWKKHSVWDVADKFEVPRGFVQNLLSSAAAFASTIFYFCEELEEFWALRDLLQNFIKKLQFCVTMELIPLMEISSVKQGRAKQLYRAGFKTVQDIANSDPEKLVTSILHMPRKAARHIVTSAKLLLKEKATALWEEAEELFLGNS